MSTTLRKRQHVDYSRIGTDFTVNENDRTHLPKGWYYVGDLCYVIGRNSGAEESDWDTVCEETSFSSNEWYKIIRKQEGVPPYYIFMGHTAYGDGEYPNEDDKRETYPVDSGTIGCLYLDNLEDEERNEILKKVTELDEGDSPCGHIHRFDTKVDFKCDDDEQEGRFEICGGELCIVTGDDEEEDDEEDEEDDDESSDKELYGDEDSDEDSEEEDD
jgi:hypothetical protein